jgi:hypothetical protein
MEIGPKFKITDLPKKLNRGSREDLLQRPKSSPRDFASKKRIKILIFS